MVQSRRIGFDLQKLATLGVLAVIVVVFSLLTPKFLTYLNLNNVMMQVSLIMLTGSAMALLMISGNLDLSVGGVLACAGVMHAYMSKHGIPTNLSILMAALIGGGFGILNGFMVTRLQITPVVATLGTMYVGRGMAFLIARWDGGANIATGLPRDFEALGRTMVGPVPLPLVIVLAVVLLFIFVQTKTVFGRFLFVIGGNRISALLSGVKVNRTVTLMFTVTGLLAGLCGAIFVSRIGTGPPKIGTGFEFDVIVAVVLGGTSIYGGEGSVLGMVLGALIVGFVANGFNLLDVHSFYQTLFKGVVLVAAILLDQTIKRRFA